MEEQLISVTLPINVVRAWAKHPGADPKVQAVLTEKFRAALAQAKGSERVEAEPAPPAAPEPILPEDDDTQ